MKLQIYLLFLALTCNAYAYKSREERDPAPQPEVECDMVQPFDPDYKYTYKYVAVTEHRDVANGQGNDIRITCTAVITVPRRCSGKLRVNDCKVEEGKMTKDGSMTYVVLPSSTAFDREMGVSEMAFQFNEGQITRVFADKQERTNVTNFKRGMLSSLQAYNPQMPKEYEIGDVFQLPQVTVYGHGVAEHKIVQKTGSYASVVEVTRDTSKIELPWKRRQWNFIRTRSNNMHPLLSAFKNYMTISNEERWAKTEQRCVYKLERGRRVLSARCEEIFPQNPIQPNIASYMMTGEPLETRIRQEIDLTNSGRMTARDRSKWDVTRFNEDSVMFQEEWEETNMAYNSGFDAGTTFLSLVRNPVNDKAPALVSKLSRWMAISTQEEIEKVWAKCETECNPEQKKDGRILWAELLNSCITNDWCQIPYCSNENSAACENALDSFIRTPAGETPEVKTACLASLESIPAPSSKIVDATLRLCRGEERPTPQCIYTLGTVAKNFLDTCGSDCKNKKPVENAKLFLLRQLKQNCQTGNSEIERAMVAAAECIGRFGPEGRYAEETLLTCSVNPAAPSPVVVKALTSYGNITGETLNPVALKKLIELFKNKAAKFETRVMCFHVLTKKSLPPAEVEKVLATVMDDSEHYSLISHCREDLRTQLPLRGSVFCNIHPVTAESCIKSIVQHSYDIGIDPVVLQKKAEERKFEWTREVLLPYLDISTPCTLTINSLYQDSIRAAIPIISQFNVQCEVEKTNITVVEGGVEIGGIRSIMEKIFGHNQFYADMFAQVFGTPDEPKQQYPTMNKLISEGKYSLLQDMFRARPPFYLKVLGQDIGVDALSSFAKMRQITIGNIWKILDIIEEGIEHQKFAVGQPFLMQHASPTCIGAPMISTIDISYILKNKLSLKANLQRMLFSPNEDAIISIAPELHVTGVISRNILKQFTPACGTTMKFKLGHGSGLDCSVNTNPKGLNVVCKPKPGKSNVFYISGKRSLSGPSEELPTASICVDYRQRNLYNLQICHQPVSESGFAYEVNIQNELDTEFQAAIEWETKQEPGSSAIARELKVECAANSRTAPKSKKMLWSSILSMIPSKNEIRCKIDCEWLKWQGATNFMFTRKSGSAAINGCFMSANASGINSLEMRYFNTFKIIPASDKKYIIEGVSNHVPTMDGPTGYKIIGAMEEAKEGTNTSRKINLNVVDIANVASPILSYSFVAKKVPTGLERMPGYETLATFGGKLIPFYKTVVVEMVTYDNDKMYDKIMRISGDFPTKASNPHFLVHRVKGLWRQPASPVYESEMYAVSNCMHTVYKAKCDASGSTHVQMRIDIPDTEISYADVVSGGALMNYNVQRYTRPVATFVECNYTDQLLPSGDRGFEISLGHRIWNSVEQSYKYEKGCAKYVNYKECPLCHSFEVSHPKTSMTSISRYSSANPNNYHEEKWIKLHYSLLDYITLYPSVSYYLINNLKSDYAEVGYKVSSKEINSQTKNVELSAALLRNTGRCSIKYPTQGKEYNLVVDCALDASIIPLNAEVKITGVPTEQDKLAVSIASGMRYAGVGCLLEGSLKLRKSNDVTCNLNLAYGSHPKFEYESLLDFSTVHRDTKIAVEGFYRSTYKPRSVIRTYKFTGSSAKVDENKRDLELKFLCPDSEKMCASLTVYKGPEWISFKRLVNEEYDRASISYDENLGVYTVDARSVNEILWGVRNVKLLMEYTRATYGFTIKTPICNMSYHVSDNTGIEAYSNFKTSWLQHRISLKANFDSAKYSLYWNNADAGGVRVSSSMSLNYAILNFDKAFDAKIKLGTAPRAFVCSLAVPDFTFDLALGRDSERPTQFKYYCDVHAIPDKIIVQRLKLPIMRRDLEMSETTLQCERRDSRIYGISASNIAITLSPACKGLEPIVVKGSAALNPEKILVKLEDAKRSFVTNVAIDTTNWRNMHMEYIFTVWNNKVDLYWDMKKENHKWMANCKCELSSMCWKTNEITPYLTFVTEYDIAETAPTANFPEIKSHCRFNHTLRFVPIPYENEVTFNTEVDGMTTKMIYRDMMSPKLGSEVNTTITGCHMRLELMPGISICMPETMTMKLKYWSSYVSGYEVYAFKKIGNNWDVKMDLDFVAPHQSDPICKQKINAVISGWKCAEGENFCWPKQLQLKNVDYISSRGANRFYVELIPGYRLFAPSEYYDIDTRNSEIYYSRESPVSHSLKSTIRQPTVTASTVTITVTVDSHKLGCDIKIEHPEMTVDYSVEGSYNPETYGWEYKQSCDYPGYKSSAVLKASSPLTLTMCDIKWKMPNGFVRDFTLDYTPGTPNKISLNLILGAGEITGNTNSVMTWNSANGEWQCTEHMKCPWVSMDMTTNGIGWKVTKADLTYKTSGMIREISIHFGGKNDAYVCHIGTFNINVIKSGQQWICNIGCSRYPWMNQTVSLEYSGDAVTQWQAKHDSVYSTCTLKFATTAGKVNAQELDCKMKNSPAAAKIEYMKEAAGRRCRMTFKSQDGAAMSCLTTPMASESTHARLECGKLEGSKETKFASVPVTMMDFPFMGDSLIADKAIFLARTVGFCYKAITYSEEQLYRDLQTSIQCADEAICRNIAQIIKKDYYAILKEMRRVGGPKAYYYTRPAIGEYAIYNAIGYIPGSITLLGGLGRPSVASDIKSLMNGNEISLIHWSFQPYYELKVGIKIVDKENAMILTKTDSEKYPWLRGTWTITNELVEGQRIVNITSEHLSSRSVMLFSVDGTHVRPLAQEFCTPGCMKSAIMVFNPEKTSDGRDNVTSMFTKDGRLQFICDVLSTPDDWAHTEIECFTEKERINKIGKLSFTNLPKLASYNILDTDEILREIFNVKSASRRNTISKYLKSYSNMATDKIYDYVRPTGGYGTAFHAVQYAIASLMHEIAPYETTQEAAAIASRLLRSFSELQPDVSRAYTDISNLVSGLHINWEIEALLQNIITPIIDAIGYVLEGHVGTRFQPKDGALWLMTDVSSTRFPLCNFQVRMRIKSLAWNSVIVNATVMHEMLTVKMDCHLDGPGFYIQKLGVTVPGVENQHMEMRFYTNPKSHQLMEHEIYIINNEQKVYHACRGSQRTYHVPIWHYTCYVTERDYLPPNPPSSSVYGSFDIDVGDLPGSPVGMLTRLMRMEIAMLRSMIDCCTNPSHYDEIWTKIMNVQDPKIRRYMTESYGKACRAWEKILERDEIKKENEHQLVSLTRKYKYHSYDSMMSYAKKQIRPTEYLMREEYDFSAISNVLSVVYPWCAPVVHYSVMVAEYLAPSGLFNVSRNTRRPSTLGESRMTMSMKSAKLPILNYESLVTLSSEGVMNTSIEGGCVWGWLECEIAGFRIIPKRTRFGAGNSRDGMEVVFWPDVSVRDPVLMAFRFNADKIYSCDARVVEPFMVTLHCHSIQVGEQGPMDAICQITPMKLYSATSKIISKAVGMRVSPTPVVSTIIDDTCTIKNPAFKEAVVSNLVRAFSFFGQYCRQHVSSFINACAKLLNLTKSFAWKVTVNSYGWLGEIINACKGINLERWYSMARKGVDAFIGLCENITIGLYEAAKLFYQSGYETNRIAYDLPSYLPALAEYEKIVPQYSHAYYNYMKMLATNTFAGPNCAAGMIHAASFEQLITLNNHLYTLPKALGDCSYLLASDVKDRKFEVTLSKNDIEIKLPSRTIIIDSNVRVFDGGRKGRNRDPVNLPMYSEEISCVREKESLTCRTPVVIVTVLSTNNVRTAFYVKVAEVHCANTRGMMGVGSNTTEIARMTMMNGKVATSMKEFIESFNADPSCHVKGIPSEPEVSHDHCDKMFENENWINQCPNRRRSFMKACQQSARSPADVCLHVKHFNTLCRMEGRLVKMIPECEMCKGKETVLTTINKVRVTVVMSLSMRNSKQSLQEVIESVHTMAKRSDIKHEISFMTFGGRNELFGPACQVKGNMLCTPTSMPWTVPEVELNGPVPTLDSLESTMWFVYENTPRAAEGVQNIYLLVVPEYMDFTSISTTAIGKVIREDMTQTYLYIPNTCRRIGVKTGATMGIRSLLTPMPTDTCVRTPDKLAAAVLSYPHTTAHPTVSCACREINPFTGECWNTCVPSA